LPQVTRRPRPPAHRWAALALAAAVLLAGCGSSDEPEAAPSSEPSAAATGGTQVETFVDEEAGFAIDVPADWEVDGEAQGVAVRALPPQEETGFADNLTVIVDDTATGTAEQYVDAALSSTPELVDDFAVVRREEEDGLGLFEFTASAQGSPLHVLVGVVVVEGTAYVASYTATEETYDEHRQAAEQAVRSLRAA
jgi:predicted Zn-dependent protease